MIKNYIKVILRNLTKNIGFTVINVLGLSFGMACFTFMSLWVWNELSYDKIHENGENIYQVFGERSVSGDSHIVPYIPSSLTYHIADQLPEVTRVSRLFPAEVVIQKGDSRFSEKGVYVDNSFLEIFSFPLKEGSSKSIFKNANVIAISDELAHKYFPGESALGKTIAITQKEKKEYVITGILENPPSNSTLQPDFILPYEQFEKDFRPWWQSSNEYSYSNFNITTYVETLPGSNKTIINKKLTDLLNTYSTVEDDALFIYPFEEVYLHSDFSEGRNPTGRIKYVKIISIIALAVLLIACINFINLSSVMAGKRKVEVGLRKVVGANRIQIIFQFLTESILLSLVSVFLAITFVEILLPVFNTLTNKMIEIPFESGYFLLLLLLGGIFIGVLAGAYPATYFSSFEYFNTERQSKGTSFNVFKKSLVVLQFACSIVFIVFTIVVFQQVDYINNKDLGIETHNIISHPLHGIGDHRDVYKKELLGIPGVKSVSFTEQNPIETSNKNNGVLWQGKPENTPIFFNVLQAGEDFTQTFDIELMEGKPFSPTSKSDEVQFLVNEAAAKQIMIEDIIGLPLTVWGNKGKIRGVMKNYHHQSLMQSIEPLVVICKPTETWNAFISLDNVDNAVIENVESVYKKYEASYPFNISFLEDEYKNKYGSVVTAGNLSITFSIAAILISCLGLFGLSAFAMQNKLKEIGIRKVMGANTLGMIYQLSVGFIKLVLVAFLIGFPVAWVYSSRWLSDFSYHTTLDYWPFIYAGLIAISIALITVIFNTVKASMTNPVNNLKEE